MYVIARLLLLATVALSLYSLMLGTLVFWPWSGFLLAAIAFLRTINSRQQRLTNLGSARWADKLDFQAAGMLEADTGLLLGEVPTKPAWRPSATGLLSPRIPSSEACRQFLKQFQREHWEMIWLRQAIHTLVVAPTGAGKNFYLITNHLRSCPDSMVVVDLKGELARLTAEYRRRYLGHQIALLDPYRVVTNHPDTFNPLDRIRADSPLAIDDCNGLANALVIRAGEEKEPHWNDSAEAWISAMLATVVYYGKPAESRSLQTMRDLLSQPDRIETAIKLMLESDAWGGMLARKGGQLMHFVDREKSSTLSTVSRHLRFLDTPAIAASTAASSFDPRDLVEGKLTIYLILPPEHLRSQSALLRMWIGSFLQTIVRGGLK